MTRRPGNRPSRHCDFMFCGFNKKSMALWFRAHFYNAHHCFLTYLQWGVENTLFFPMNSVVFVVSKHLFFWLSFYGKLCFVWVSAAQNVTVLFFCLQCLTRCVSLTKLCLSKSAMKHADLSASGAIATYECTCYYPPHPPTHPPPVPSLRISVNVWWNA